MSQTVQDKLITGKNLKKPSAFRSDIQGLRAIAVLVVIADHLLGYPIGGFVGVDIFFVVSGFLITGLLIREQERQGHISFVDFYRRRVRRIVPVAAIVIIATCAASWAIFPTSRAQSIASDGFWALIFGANWHYAIVGTDYMQAEGPVSPLQHFWSLAVEEQFYVIWPWIIVLVLGVIARRLSLDAIKARRILTVTFTAIVIVSFMFAVWESVANPTVAYFSTLSRAWELAVGSLLALTSSKFLNLPIKMRKILAYTGLCGIAWSLLFVTTSMPFPGPWAIVPVLGTTLVIVAGTGNTDNRYIPVLTNPVSQYIGNISYSLYLWHFPVIVIMGAIVPQESSIEWFLLIIGMFALSIASYHFIEDPIRKSSWLEPGRKAKRSKKSHLFDNNSIYAGVTVLALLTTLVSTLAFTKFASLEPDQDVQAHIGTTSINPPTASLEIEDSEQVKLQAELAAAVSASSWPELDPSVDELKDNFVPEWVEDRCLNVNEDNVADCLYGDPSATKTAILLGDSVSISWMPGLRESLGAEGWKIQLLTMGQCPAIGVPVTRPNDADSFTTICLNHQKWALNKVMEMNPDMVIVNSSLGTINRIAGADEIPDKMGIWSDATVEKLKDLKGSIDGDVVLLSVALYGANLQECATKISRPSDCTISNDNYLSTVNVEKAAAAKVTGVRFISTVPWFCTANNRCPAFAGNTPIFVDGSHMTPEYSSRLARVLGPALLGTQGN